MKIKISELSKMTGFSPSGIRFLEKVGIIAPNRTENQKYRDFSLVELSKLCIYKYFRELGFSSKETVDLVSIMSPEKLKARLKVQNDKLLQEIEEKKCLSKLIEEQIESINLSQSEEPFFRIERNPALLRLQIWQPESNKDAYLPFSQITEWMNHFPFVSFCVLFSSDDIQNRNGDLESYWGIAIEKWIANILRFSPRMKGEYIPSHQCIHVVVEISYDRFTINSNQLNHVRQFMNNNNLIVSSPAINMRIFSESLSNKNSYLSHLWIPIKRK
jgi:DNA-binding transcriptional MerR regulator